MASPDRDINSEDSGDSVRNSQEVDESVNTIFEEISDSNIQMFNERMEFINENKFGDVWSDEGEKHVKTMRHAKTFVSAVAEAFRSQHDSLSEKIVRGSACDAFQIYVLKRLGAVVEKVGMLERSSKEMESKIIRKISEIKEKLEKKEVKEMVSQSDVDQVISKSKLMDPVHINHALLCCKVAYKCKDLEKPEKCFDEFDRHWLSEIVVSHQSPEVPRYVMARCGNVLYVAFRGLDNAVYTTIVGSAMPNTCWKGQTNSKIYKEAQKIPLGYFAREIVRNNRIIFTGHSTGGAIASLVVISLLDKLRGLPADYIKRAIKCITFGMTPVGDKHLKEFVESSSGMKECFCNIVKHNDVIPKLFGSNMFETQ